MKSVIDLLWAVEEEVDRLNPGNDLRANCGGGGGSCCCTLMNNHCGIG